MHEYTCTECAPRKFYTDFAPIFDEPAFCPCCGSSKEVTYVGLKKSGNPIPELEAMQMIIVKLSKARYQGGGYNLSDLDNWLENEFSKMTDLIMDARMEVEGE